MPWTLSLKCDGIQGSYGAGIVRTVARLSARDRAALADRQFAYVDSAGRRRLPINDEIHVRNALARFDRVDFESDEAKDRARQRLLNAAKRFGIMPMGFVARQLRSARGAPDLPTGSVTFLLTDIEGSTALLRALDDGYASLLRDVRRVTTDAARPYGGYRVDAYGDEYLSVFERPEAAVRAAVALQRALGARTWPGRLVVRVRAGVHTGRPTLTDTGYVGLSVHTVARICSVAHGGQILVSSHTAASLDPMLDGIALASLGAHRLAGLPRDEELFQVVADGLLDGFPPLRLLS
jgi:class 3 adenylate cyclase